jgi:hypothetical protein
MDRKKNKKALEAPLHTTRFRVFDVFLQRASRDNISAGYPQRLATDAGFSKEYYAFGSLDRYAAGNITPDLQIGTGTR